MDPGTVATTGHPACTAAMGTNPDRVLDPQLRVRGVAGLRVADASAPASACQRQCPGDHDRRTLRGLHALGLWITLVTSDRGDTIRTCVLLICFSG